MIYLQEDDKVTLEMTRTEYEELLMYLGAEAGEMQKRGEQQSFWDAIDFVNRLNVSNPHWFQVEIPEEFKRRRHATEPCG